MAVVLAELNVVLVKLAPAELVKFANALRFITWPLGAFNAITRSLTHAWVILNLTLTLAIVAPTGIPEAVILETIAGYEVGTGGIVGPSGMVIFTVPEVNVEPNCCDEELFNLTAGSPRHIVTEDGTTVGAGGV